MVADKILILVLYLARYIVHCSGSCLETADVVYEEQIEYDYDYDNQQHIQQVKSISVTCYVTITDGGSLPLDGPKQYDCSLCPRSLTLKSSIIPVISSSTFINYPFTTVLDVRNSEVEIIQPETFDLLKSLQVLYLSQNKITHIAEDLFHALVSLEILDLSENKIQNLSAYTFEHLSNLRLLNLSLNNLMHFSSDHLINMHLFRHLDLSHNKLTVFNFTRISPYVHLLDLSNNRIDNIFGCFASVPRLDISKNLLTTLENITCEDYKEKNSLSNLTSTIHLFLQENNINFIPNGFFSNLNNLTHLNLSTNELDKLQYGLFDGLSSLTELDISNNRLTAFRKFNYHLLKNLRHLYLHDNEISIFDSKDFTESLTQLKHISLYGNNFTCDRLVAIVHDLKATEIVAGHSFDTSNINGIACLEVDYTLETTTEQNVDFSQHLEAKLIRLFNIDLTRSSMYNYFNKNFRNSSFYRYLENIQLNINDFKKKFNDTEYIQGTQNDSFRGTNFVEYLETLKKSDSAWNNSFDARIMDNYFNKDFINSSFYKNVEAWKSPHFEINYTKEKINSEIEKLMDAFIKVKERDEISIYLIIITVILVITVCVMLWIMCVTYIKFIKKL